MVFMQGTSDSNPELLDALAMCGHLVVRDSVCRPPGRWDLLGGFSPARWDRGVAR